MTTREILPDAPRQPLLVGCSVSPTFVPALEMVAEALREKHPKATVDQVFDMIFFRGITGYTNDLRLPRPGSNPDEDA